MNEQFRPEQQPKEQREEVKAVRIEDWAKQHQHETLRRFIESSDMTNRNIGILREKMTYDPGAKSMTLTLDMQPELHRGHTIADEYEVMIGGMPKAFADVNSGALAFTEVPTNALPLHTTITESNMGMMILQHEVPVIVRSSFVTDPQQGSTFSIKTVVSQGPNICFTEICDVRVGTENAVARVAKITKNSLDSWVEKQKTGSTESY